MMRRRSAIVATFALSFSLALVACSKKPAGPVGPTPQQKADLAAKVNEAYVYTYPLVLMDVTRELSAGAGGEGAAINAFSHKRTFPDHTARDANPDADALHSRAMLDVSAEPVILTLPAISGRYYVLTLLDAWSNAFATFGKRSASKPGSYAIVGPGWQGELPKGVERVDAPTGLVRVDASIQTNSNTDFAAVNRLQDGLKLTPLAAWGKPATKAAAAPAPAGANAAAPKSPLVAVRDMHAPAYFSRVATLLTANPPAAGDSAVVETLKAIGVEAGKPFAPDAALVRTYDEAVKAADAKIAEARQKGTAQATNGWAIERFKGQWGTEYLSRAALVSSGLVNAQEADVLSAVARQDADGREFNGRFQYVVHFDKGQLPPANAFWSLSLYDDQQAFVENELWRYNRGSRDKLKTNSDGSVDLFVQNANPGKDKEANWLPAPRAGAFHLNLRLYGPKDEILTGTWNPPAVTRVEVKR